MSNQIGGRHQMNNKDLLVLRESKRKYYTFVKHDQPIRNAQWTVELLRDFLICAHTIKDIRDIYIVSGEEISVKCSFGNLPVSLEEKNVLCVTPSSIISDFFYFECFLII